MIERSAVSFLIIIWFLAGRQLGHMGAKYARRKKSSAILFSVLMLIAIIATIVIFR